MDVAFLLGCDGKTDGPGNVRRGVTLFWNFSEGFSEGAEIFKVIEPEKSHFRNQQKAGWCRVLTFRVPLMLKVVDIFGKVSRLI